LKPFWWKVIHPIRAYRIRRHNEKFISQLQVEILKVCVRIDDAIQTGMVEKEGPQGALEVAKVLIGTTVDRVLRQFKKGEK
jgi:hypothetical protein